MGQFQEAEIFGIAQTSPQHVTMPCRPCSSAARQSCETALAALIAYPRTSLRQLQHLKRGLLCCRRPVFIHCLGNVDAALGRGYQPHTLSTWLLCSRKLPCGWSLRRISGHCGETSKHRMTFWSPCIHSKVDTGWVESVCWFLFRRPCFLGVCKNAGLWSLVFLSQVYSLDVSVVGAHVAE